MTQSHGVLPSGVFSYCTNLKEVVFNEGLQKIGLRAFQSCTSLTIVTLPSTVTEVGNTAFAGCTNLKEVIFNEGVQEIGCYTFQCCPSLAIITLSSTVTVIGRYAFNQCTNLREVILNDGLQKIGDWAFSQCKFLTIVKLPLTVNEVGAGAFNGCTNLREVELTEGLRRIGWNAFPTCPGLAVVKFPSISKRATNLIDMGITEVEDKLTANQYFEWRGGELLVSREAIKSANWRATRTHLDRVLAWVSYYELRETTTTIELAFWKIKIGETGAATAEERDACRCEVPGPMKDAINQCLEVDVFVDGNESEGESSQYIESDEDFGSGEDESGDDWSDHSNEDERN